MPRAMWRGAIQFGLVTIPVRLYLATESRGGLSFNLLHEEDLNRIQMKVHCPEHGEISRSETVRGFEWSKGQYVVIEESDFEAVPLKTVRSIEIEQFVPTRRDEHSTTFVKQCYYLEPEAVGLKAFRLLKTILAESDLQAICKIVLKDREQLAALDPFGSTMLLSTLYWPDEVRDVGELEIPEDGAEFKPTELAMARQLVDALTGEFDASQYRDEYREALLDVIEAKVAGRPVEAAQPAEEPSKLTDLMAVLEASVAAARTGDGAPAAGGARQKSKKAEEPVSVESARKARARSGSKPKKSAAGASSSSAKRAGPSSRKQTGSASSSSRSSSSARRRKTA